MSTNWVFLFGMFVKFVYVDALTIRHLEASLFAMAPPAVEFLHARHWLEVFRVEKDAADTSRAPIQILVRAPGGKVNAPVVQLQLDGADRVRQIPADIAALDNENIAIQN